MQKKLTVKEILNFKGKKKLAEVYKSLLGAFLPAKDKVENQSFLAVNVK